MQKIAWIGSGVMGKSMVTHLLNNNYNVSVYTRTIEKAESLKTIGAHVVTSLKEAIVDADIIFTMVGYPKDVEDLYFQNEGIIQLAKENCIAIDMTTSSPKLAQRLYEEGKKKHISIMDAPVSGGDSGAIAATLSIMVGGDKTAFDLAYPLLQLIGKNIQYMGTSGCGQHTKMANQIAVAGAVSAMSEAIYYARKVGLDEQQMLTAISQGAAGSWQINNTAPRVLKKDFNPGFYIKHFVKDMHIVQEEAKNHHATLPMLNTVCTEYEELMEQGLENLGTQALIHYYENQDQ